MNKLIFLFIILFAGCKTESTPDFDFYVVKNKISKKSKTIYTFSPIRGNGTFEIGVLESNKNWSEIGDTLVRSNDGTMMRWKVMTNPNHPDYLAHKEGSNE